MEFFDILDIDGTITGKASRPECHNGSHMLHGVVHVLVFTSRGGIILQKRSMNKEIEPGKWDTSVGGHIESGETVEDALVREAREELGINGIEFERLYSYIMTTDIEREYVTTFRCIWDCPVVFPEDEISDIRVFTAEEIASNIDTGIFTPNFVDEWHHYQCWLSDEAIPNNHEAHISQRKKDV